MNFISKKFGSFLAIAPVLALSLAALPGCGYNEADYCDDQCACTGCSPNEYDECIDTSEDLARKVDDEGCGDFYDEYYACLGDEFVCRGGKIDDDGCEVELGRVLNCLK